MVADEPHHLRGLRLLDAHTVHGTPGKHLAPEAVILVRPLADVVEQPCEQQGLAVGLGLPGDAPGQLVGAAAQLGKLRDHLVAVHVHGVAVVDAALRQAADPVPLRQRSREGTPAFEGAEPGPALRARREQADEALPGLARPLRGRPSIGAEREQADERPGLAAFVAGTEHGVQGEGDRAAALVERPHQLHLRRRPGCVGDERLGHRDVVLHLEHVGVAAGDVVQLVAHPVQQLGGLGERPRLRRDLPGTGDRLDPADRCQVGESSGTVHEVGLETRAGIVGGGTPGAGHRAQVVEESLRGAAAPSHQLRLPVLEQGGVADEQAGVEEPQLGVEPGAGEAQRLLGGVDGVAEVQLGPPQLVGEGLGGIGGVAAPGVEDQQVEARCGGQLLAAVLAERDERAAVIRHEPLPQTGDRGVEGVGELPHDEGPGSPRRVACPDPFPLLL